MKASEISTKAPKLYIPQPFASKSGAAYTAIANADDGSGKVNFEDGFPPAFGAPHSGNGKFVTRGEMNAIGRLASQNQFFQMCGGVFTFDPVLSAKIGGYYRGAVLDYIQGNGCFKVISLHDDNTTDFTEVGVDGVNWAYCATVQEGMAPNWSEANASTLYTISENLQTRDAFVKVGAGIFPRNGYIRCWPSERFTQSYPTSSTGIVIVAVLGGLSGYDVSSISPDDVEDTSDCCVLTLLQSIDGVYPVPVSGGCSYSIWVKQNTGTQIVEGSMSVKYYK